MVCFSVLTMEAHGSVQLKKGFKVCAWRGRNPEELGRIYRNGDGRYEVLSFGQVF